MYYYSEKTGRLYDTVEELQAAEAERAKGEKVIEELKEKVREIDERKAELISQIEEWKEEWREKEEEFKQDIENATVGITCLDFKRSGLIGRIVALEHKAKKYGKGLGF